jgi:very-short-patch-repair endonuclease
MPRPERKARRLSSSPPAGEGRDGGSSPRRPPPQSSPARGEEAGKSSGEGRDGGSLAKHPPPQSSPARGEEAGKSLGKGQDGGMCTPRARLLRRNPTPTEQLLWRSLRLRQLDGYKFRRQQPLGPYIADFVCLDARLIVELDGGHHMTAAEYDAERTAWLESQNFRVIRFWNHEVMSEPEAVLEMIQEVLKAPPHLYPPPQGGRKRKTAVKNHGAFRCDVSPSPPAGEGRDGGRKGNMQATRRN